MSCICFNMQRSKLIRLDFSSILQRTICNIEVFLFSSDEGMVTIWILTVFVPPCLLKRMVEHRRRGRCDFIRVRTFFMKKRKKAKKGLARREEI